MARILKRHVHVHDADGGSQVLKAGTAEGDLPKSVRDKVGDHAFVDADDTSDDDENDGPPPKSGKGSGKDNWVAYAESIGVEVEEDATKDDIIAAVEAAEADNG